MAAPDAISALCAAIDDVRALSPTLATSGQVLEALELLETTDRQLRAIAIRWLRDAAERDVTAEECGRSPRSWLVEEQNISPADAARRMRLVHGLPTHPQLEAAFDIGDLTDEHAQVILRALAQVPTAYVDTVESALIELAKALPPHETARAVDEILVRLGVESSADAAAARRYSQRSVNMARTFGGTGSLSGTLTPELAEKLELIFADCAKRVGPEDERDAGQRRHDRLEEVLDHCLGSSDGLPNICGERPRVIVTMDIDSLLNDLSQRWGILDSGRSISPATARRLACDAEILPAVLGAPGGVLDIGGLSRSFSAAVKRAALIRDGGRCGFPGCRRRLAECHHIVWWSNGGKSTLENAVWLCAFHHWLAHEGGWLVRRNPDGSYTWTNKHGKSVTGDPPPRQPQAA